MNEWVTVRREERAIYTRRQNLTVQIYVESSDTDYQNFWLYYKNTVHNAVNWANSVIVETPSDCQDFWQPELPASVGTFDRQASQAAKS